MKKLFSTLFVVFFATSLMAQTGLTCEDPIPVNKSYVGTVNAGDELWYTASTYDLPMHVYFSPDIQDSKNSPEVMIDFTCDPGVYADHKLDSVLKILKTRNVHMPVDLLCDKVVRNGKVEWDLSIDESYRDQLTEYGLTHNIQAFVKVYYPDGGEIRLTPDQQFQNCMENGRYVKLGDTIDIAANDSNTMLVLPFSEWKNDSIRFVWIGDKDARVWVAEEECQFTPTDASIYIKAKYDLNQNTIKKLYPEDMQLAIDNWIGKGIFYAKVLSAAPGKLVVERIPLGEIQGGATLLKHGQQVKLAANDNRVFCFPKGWNATEFLANTQFIMAMHVSNTPDFQPGDANVLTVYPFTKEDGKRKLQLTSGDISHLGASSTDDYLYVRFTCNIATTMTPSRWDVSSCLDKTVLITSGVPISLSSSSSKIVYRMLYADWKDYDFTAAWNKTTTLSAYVASYCEFVTTATDLLTTIVLNRRRPSYKVTSSVVGTWAASLQSDGFIFVRLVTTENGQATFTSSKPAEVDPEIPVIPTSPCVVNSIELKAGDQLTLNLDSAFTIYRIKYAEFAAQDRTLTWTGAEPLHTFVAETCTFAVAPYNKYVHVYVPVRDEEVLTAAKLAELAEFVDEDGFLYIRFLTEKEGVLTVK